MVKLACNYLVEAVELLNEEKIKFDYFKYPSLGSDDSFRSFKAFSEKIKHIKTIKPVLYHGFYPYKVSICNQRFQENFDIESFRKLCNISETPGISFHLNGADLNDSKDMVITSAIENILFIKKHFKDMEFITFENAMGNLNEHELNPEVISEIINKSDSKFLYDVSHAYWSSKKRGETFDDYVSKLPLDRVYEVHINGWQESDGDIQSHMKIQDELYPHLKDIVSRYPVEIVTLEYGRHYDRINCGCPVVNINKVNLEAKKEVREQLLRLKEIIG
ncbi:DUF692 family multinuclear iron-containing protein [Dethiothermospora halolimnae]|uniref:multinuclear nonheme iron-dependent oxidase n=1 Tax=Dethiothermospora halolimnae TaxID=3114390 RepID=UPI003CCC1AF3